MAKQWQDNVAVITGAASGIGRALAVRLAQEGCHLALCDVNTEALEETAALVRDAGREVFTSKLDVADRAAFSDFVDAVIERFGGVHIVINNAGVTVVDTVEHMSWEDFEWLMGINFWGMVYGSKLFLPHLKKQKQAYLLNVSSVFGFIAVPTQSSYNASKFGIRGFTEALGHEFAGTNVYVGSIHPGGIKTNIARSARHYEDGVWIKDDHDKLSRRFDKMAKTTPEKAADTIVRGMKKKKSRILIGKDAVVIDWIQRIFPTLYRKIILKFM
jgi:butyryl-CoA dehydrogenase